jgi:hypothetical protein
MCDGRNISGNYTKVLEVIVACTTTFHSEIAHHLENIGMLRRL